MEESAGIYEKRYDTGIVLFDVILNDKTVDADRMGITFTASVDIRSLPDMMQYDVAVDVGNLIDTEFTVNGNDGVRDGVVRSTGFFLKESSGAGTIQHVDMAIGSAGE